MSDPTRVPAVDAAVKDPHAAAPSDPDWLDPGLGPVDYVFGYGSLIQDRSRGFTLDVVGLAHPVRVTGLRRAWNVHGPGPGFSTTFLGVTREESAACNGVLAPVYPNEWRDLDARERNYRRVEIDPAAIGWLTPTRPPVGDGVRVWAYEAESPAEPNDRLPIIQSYIDICLDGCLAIDERLGTGEAFAREFVATTDGWSRHWVNDRQFPRAPFRTVPRAGAIDRLLAERCPEPFAAIRIE
ncbi:MAG: gamma-glutamylcyclotransferase family protein [Planctomycetota bacterium]